MDKTPQLVLLEDDIPSGVKLSIELESAGFEVSRHTTASSALEFVANNHVDLIIADILIKVDGELVQDGGVKLISQLHQIQDHPAPIIAVSSMFQSVFGANMAITTAKTVGACATLAKPFATVELIAIINLHLPARH